MLILVHILLILLLSSLSNNFSYGEITNGHIRDYREDIVPNDNSLSRSNSKTSGFDNGHGLDTSSEPKETNVKETINNIAVNNNNNNNNKFGDSNNIDVRKSSVSQRSDFKNQDKKHRHQNKLDLYLPRLDLKKSAIDNHPGKDTSPRRLNITTSNYTKQYSKARIETSDNYVQEMYNKLHNNITDSKGSNDLKGLTQSYIDKLHPYKLNISVLHPFVIKSCPEIIQYYSSFNLYMNKRKILHVKYHITGLCLVKFLTRLFELKPCINCGIKSPMMLWAGSLLGIYLSI
jgi:hypothetical protein